MKKLVLFYSRAEENYFGGSLRYIEVRNTEKAAGMISELTGARPELIALPDSMEEYDEIYLGFPNYWGTMPMAVFSMLEVFDWTGKIIKPFCTHEGSGMGSSENDIQKVCKGAKVEKGLAIHGSSVDSAKAAIETWL